MGWPHSHVLPAKSCPLLWPCPVQHLPVQPIQDFCSPKFTKFLTKECSLVWPLPSRMISMIMLFHIRRNEVIRFWILDFFISPGMQHSCSQSPLYCPSLGCAWILARPRLVTSWSRLFCCAVSSEDSSFSFSSSLPCLARSRLCCWFLAQCRHRFSRVICDLMLCPFFGSHSDTASIFGCVTSLCSSASTYFSFSSSGFTVSGIETKFVTSSRRLTWCFGLSTFIWILWIHFHSFSQKTRTTKHNTICGKSAHTISGTSMLCHL